MQKILNRLVVIFIKFNKVAYDPNDRWKYACVRIFLADQKQFLKHLRKVKCCLLQIMNNICASFTLKANQKTAQSI